MSHQAKRGKTAYMGNFTPDFLIPITGKAAALYTTLFKTPSLTTISFKNGARAGIDYMLNGRSIPRLYATGSRDDLSFREGVNFGAGAARNDQYSVDGAAA